MTHSMKLFCTVDSKSDAKVGAVLIVQIPVLANFTFSSVEPWIGELQIRFLVVFVLSLCKWVNANMSFKAYVHKFNSSAPFKMTRQVPSSIT